MSYNTIARCANDGDLQQRVTACAAQEGIDNPNSWAVSHRWNFAANPDVANAYSYAVGQGIEAPGKRDDVINDNVILTVVQTLRAGESA